MYHPLPLLWLEVGVNVGEQWGRCLNHMGKCLAEDCFVQILINIFLEQNACLSWWSWSARPPYACWYIHRQVSRLCCNMLSWLLVMNRSSKWKPWTFTLLFEATCQGFPCWVPQFFLWDSGAVVSQLRMWFSAASWTVCLEINSMTKAIEADPSPPPLDP